MALHFPTRLQHTKSLPEKPAPLALSGKNDVPGLRRRPCNSYALRSVLFLSPTMQHFVLPGPPQVAPKFSMRVASKQAYICRDCGYIYKDKTPFEKLQDNFFCPVCGAPKRRFRAYQASVNRDANSTDVRKVRKEQMKKDEAIGKALPVAIVVGVAALAGLYFYVNSSF